MASHRLGRYTLLDELARGGMSRVYVAQKDGADGVCVLKQLLVELKSHELASRRFYREAHIASFLDHPNIARLLDAGFEDDSFCIAVEYVAGVDVDALLRAMDGRLIPWELTTAISLLVLEALAYAHDATDPDGQPLQVVHRDVAPRNIMVGFQGAVKLIDFGLARGKVGDFETEPGVIIGTLRYLSPEQARSEDVDRRSDLYSLGVVMHELFTGRKLVQEKTPLAVLRAINHNSPPLMRAINADVPPGLEIAVARALEKNPDDRWQTAGELRSAILEVVGEGFVRGQLVRLGELARRLFPEGERKAAVLRELGRHRFASVYGRSGFPGTLSEASLHDTLPPPDRRARAEVADTFDPPTVPIAFPRGASAAEPETDDPVEPSEADREEAEDETAIADPADHPWPAALGPPPSTADLTPVLPSARLGESFEERAEEAPDETAVHDHPLVRAMVWRRRLLVVAAAAGAVALALLIVLALRR